MDLSQLPKMSETPKPPPPAVPETSTPRQGRAIDYASTPPAGAMGGVSVWISLVVGVIFLYFGQSFGGWLAATLTGKPFDTHVTWTTGPNEGQTVAYFQLQGGTAWSDAGFFTMGVALLLDAALLLVVYRSRSPRRGLVLAALAITAVALALNVGVVGYLFTLGIMPLASLVAMLTGGIMLFDQMAVLRESR